MQHRLLPAAGRVARVHVLRAVVACPGAHARHPRGERDRVLDRRALPGTQMGTLHVSGVFCSNHVHVDDHVNF